MIRVRLKLFYLLIIAQFSCLYHCSSGGGIDIGNPSRIAVVDSLNHPVIGASVKIIPAGQWFVNMFNGGPLISDSSFTDVSGYASFDSLEAGNYNLQIDCSSGGALITDTDFSDSSNVKVVMIKKYGTISGTINSESDVPSQIRIPGTTYSAPVEADGSYILPAIPEGMFIPVVMDADSHWTFTKKVKIIPSNTTITANAVSFKKLLIDDFEDSLTTLKVGRIIKDYRIYTGKANEDSSIASYQIVQEGIDGGNALKGTLMRGGHWVLLGFFLGIKPGADSLWDFSKAQGLSFNAKGKGKLNISIESDTIDKMGTYKHYSSDIILQSSWTHFSILFDSLKFYYDQNPEPEISWDQAAKSVKRIEFNNLGGDDTVQFLLDDLKVEGLDISDIYHNE